MVVAHLDTADFQYPAHFTLCEVVDRFVGGNTVFVQSAELAVAVEDDDVIPEYREPVGAGQAGRPAADDRHSFASLVTSLKQRKVVVEHRVGCVPLQQSDPDRLAFMRVAHAGFFTQHFGRAHARAHAAHDVFLENRVCRSLQVVAANFLDESGDVDACRAGRGTRRVVTEVTAIGLDQGLRPRQRRMHVTEITGDFLR